MKSFDLRILFYLSVLVVGLGFLVSCEKDDNGKIDPVKPPVITRDFQVAYAQGSGKQQTVYLQGISDLSKGEISFQGKGYKLETKRTAHLFGSSDGKYAYFLNYRVGTITKLAYQGGANYKEEGKIEANVPMGTVGIRFARLSDKEGSVHYLNPVHKFDEETEKYIGTDMEVSIGLLNLETMKFDHLKTKIPFKFNEDLAKKGYFISRIHAPIIAGNKIYYGANIGTYDPKGGRGKISYDNVDRAITLVLDYPSLENLTYIETTHVSGSTHGYRGQVNILDEKGDVLQLVKDLKNKDVYIAKIKNGKYDTSFKLSLKDKLGKKASSNAWIYAGNGIGYIPFEDLEGDKAQIGVDPNGDPTYSAGYKIARVDLNSGTAIELETPKDLWMFQFQSAVVSGGTLYIALNPVGKPGYVYMHQVNSTSTKMEKGASLKAGADEYYTGIY